ncbi:MAG: TFIIB-type zinc ribbon-containing protein [Planctomycetota bacterium]|jgi:DNA-directed RNA polymerase subunit RPC12/RpoP
MVSFRCAKCNQKIAARDKLSGKPVKCPKCGTVAVVPANPTMVKFQCENCGQKICVPAVHSGKKGKCPRCGNIVVVPKNQDTAPAEPPPPPTAAQITPKTPGLDPRLFDVPLQESTTSQPPGPQYLPDQSPRDVLLAQHAPGITGIEPPPVPQRKLPGPIDILLYPTNKAGLTMIAIIIGVPLLFWLAFALISFLSLLCPPLLVLWPVMGILGFIISLLFTMYVCWYLCECVRDSANGGLRAPETIGATPGFGELVSQFLEAFGCLAFFALPSVLYFIYTRQTDHTFWALFTLGVLLFPMGLLAVIMFDSLSGLNPILIVGSILSALLPYLGLILLIAALLFSVKIIAPMAASVLSGGSTLALAATFVLYGTGILDFYMMMVIAHLLGRFYYRYQEKLNWEV